MQISDYAKEKHKQKYTFNTANSKLNRFCGQYQGFYVYIIISFLLKAYKIMFITYCVILLNVLYYIYFYIYMYMYYVLLKFMLAQVQVHSPQYNNILPLLIISISIRNL